MSIIGEDTFSEDTTFSILNTSEAPPQTDKVKGYFFDSFMLLVSGDLAPIEILEAVGALVPVTNPGAKTSLLRGPRGYAK